jgi:Mycothiol maleylpyruvate isomerase N-terminal domain
MPMCRRVRAGTVGQVVRHTAEVYEHKIVCIQLGGARPDLWPPRWPADRDPVAWFVEAHGRLPKMLASIDPAAPAWTWWPPDQTVGCWVGRLAQETAVHRADVQSAAPSPRLTPSLPLMGSARCW